MEWCVDDEEEEVMEGQRGGRGGGFFPQYVFFSGGWPAPRPRKRPRERAARGEQKRYTRQRKGSGEP